LIPYARHSVDNSDIDAVDDALRSDFLTTGPAVERFEAAVASFILSAKPPHAVAVSSGTAALHTAFAALHIGPGDEVVVPALTFVATANAVVFCGATPVFADIDEDTLLVDPASVEHVITSKTRAIASVDYAGQPCNYDALQAIAQRHGLPLVADACHALGAHWNARPVGTLANLTVFSFHPVKHATTGEGGMIVTSDSELATRMRRFRNHGIATDARERQRLGTFHYAMEELGYNYRISDFQCALGTSQLRKVPAWLARRRAIARRYDEAFAEPTEITPLLRNDLAEHAYHLYVVKFPNAKTRNHVYDELRTQGIGSNVHYLPVYLHPFYQKHFATRAGLCPRAERAYQQILSLPMFPGLSDDDITRIVAATKASSRSPG
jgi:perosamine synthetase